ncbi:protein NRD1 [Candida albicans SC5314]|uniref:Nrd1 complex RNA-binding subunit n=1 Tax=Candida albicans (strain SC5314 / ATCC MYA-2876) TaxID=237561 RepID=A0A1D8PN05_CANAL|nr:Nrd1 complex RNA-binding subunit [Candida albicans SC5314]AOW29521.1 Nrd1 complex RNA-binding subunit [Candida albicans SC5314]KHC86142.1 protein NRD1 [Candida albicans SC5314]|eukprot:XP_714209.2 Nrd1 complex RNA-binding subunit [Candida albicans SC5314]
MSLSGMEEFETVLKEISTLPAPGVSGTRIKRLTDIAVKEMNAENEPKLISILYSQCKANSSTNKLGTLYVVDSIVRKFIEEANKKNEALVPSAPEGTYASAVFKINELVESLVDDAMELSINPSINIKIGKLIDIWARSETFSPEVIQNIRNKHFKSTTPPGSPPKASIALVKPDATEGTKESSSILSALASLAKASGSNNETPPSSQSSSTNNNSNNNSNNNNNNNSSNSNSNSNESGSNATNILSQLSALGGNSSNTGSASSQPPSQQQYSSYPQGGGQAGNDDLLNMLQQMQGGGTPTGASPASPVVGSNEARGGPTAEFDRRRGRDNEYGSQYGRRNRSRSPKRGSNTWVRSPPSSSVQALQQNMQNLRQQKQVNHGYPQNTNGQVDQGFVPPNAMGGELNLPGTPHYRPRTVQFDSTIPQGTVKVLSRTLFLGGVPRNMDERSLAQVLRPYAEIQSVILNSEKKHAFVKVYSRREAEQVITSFNKDGALPLRTRWGVGFGPRDCCNYQHGISIIPIQRLTEADKNWIVHAQWGGTGGQPISSGMVVDEPDIEIGSGLSSKAMSKKMPTNSARNGPKSNRPGEPDEEYVKTTLIPQGDIQMTHGAQPQFNTYSQSSVNPLQGLFGNNPQQQQQPPPPPQPPQPQQPPMQFPAGFPQMPPQQPGQPGMNNNEAMAMLAAMMQTMQQQQQQQHPPQ